MVKNKLAAPFREAEFDILYGEGTSREGDLLDVGVQNSVVEKSGSWFSYRGERIGQGRETARAFLVENPAAADRLDAALRRQLELTPPTSPIPVASDQVDLAQLDRVKSARTA